MSQQLRYDLLFRGDIVPGRQLDDVKARVRELFQIDDARLASLFSGRPVLIRRDLGAAEAERYRDALAAAGALVELRPVSGSPEGAAAPAAVTPQPTAVGDWGLTPVGADLLRSEERARSAPRAVDVGHLSVAPSGADVLRPEERREVAPRIVDTSHLGLQALDD
ncbi:MAG: hypothetical protein AMXMBFR26_09150 [Porticoccaceae bacterium]